MTIKTRQEVEEYLRIERDSGTLWAEEFLERKRLFAKHWFIEAAKTKNNVFGFFEPKSPVTRRDWDSHGVLWLSDDDPIVYQSQPYCFKLTDAEFLNQFCKEHGLTFEVSCNKELCWYNPGETLSVIIWVGDQDTINPMMEHRINKINSMMEEYDIETKEITVKTNEMITSMFISSTHKVPLAVGYNISYNSSIFDCVEKILLLERKENENEN